MWIYYQNIIILISTLKPILALSFLSYMNEKVQYRYSQDTIPEKESFDFIIIGSGSSGSVLANRLSEIPEWKILLLEAGNPANVLNKVPLMAPVFAATGYNWNYTTERQDGICEGMVDKVCPWPRGKALGGTTILNYMIYTRGNPEDYRRWSDENEGWSYEEVLEYYKKSEDCNLESKTCSNGYHSSGGYLSVERPFSSALTDAFVEAGVQMGSKKVDYNTRDFMGFSKMQANIKHGRRHSVADAFLLPVENRKNLRVLTSARVLRILIDPKTKQAYGVEFMKKRKIYQVIANKEVILSAGTFNSPQLLMLSGIGPTEHLKELGIQTVANLPVGKTMYDHVSYVGLAFKINQTIEPRELALLPSEILKFLLDGKGSYTSLGGVEALAYIKTNVSKEIGDYPDIELIFSGIGSFQSDYGIVSIPTLGIRQEIYDRTYRPIERIPCWSVLPMLLHPKSKGFLKLRSKNPFDPPLLYSNFFTDPAGEDLKTMIAAIRVVIEMSKTPAFQKYGSQLHDIPLPGCEKHQFNSDSYWECCLRLIAVTLHHQIGTCRMGRREDPDAVVDNRCRVHGVGRLRVVDTSVIPVTLSAHTSAPGMMIGERVSDMIKEEYNMLCVWNKKSSKWYTMWAVHIYTFLWLMLFEIIHGQVQEMLVASMEKNLQDEESVRHFLENIHNVVNRYSKVYDNIDRDHWASTEDWIPKFTLRTSYDFIIVGSGPAGSVIANRLSEVPEWNVLLIEAGDYETNFMDLPLAAPVFQYTKYNWEYYAEYQPNMSQGLMGGRMHWPRGKALGGTSTINYMIYTRGNPVDYNKWAAQGNPGWSYNEVLPYFLKSEQARLDERDPDVHNNDGLLGVENTYKSRLLDAFISGGGELGLPHIDYNSPKVPFGVSRVQANVKNGRRHSAATSFLRPARNRTNLHILHPAYVTKLLIHKPSKAVYGVECEIEDKLYKIKATKEVILSAGAFNSPQILMLSGIGPADHLKELGIKVLQDLPVGKNLQDHLTFPGLAFIINQTESLGPTKVMGGDALQTFIRNGTGPLTSLGGVEGIGYIKTQYSNEPGPQPDIELIFVGGSLSSDYGIVTRRGMKITNKVYDGLLRPLHGYPTWTIFPMLLHPKSVGWMQLKSKNPKDYPKFYGNFFSDPQNKDVKTLIAAIRFIQKLSRTKAFQRFGSMLNPNRQPGCTQYKFDSDEYWECCLRAISVTLHHQVGTAKMGPRGDPTSVVDHRLKVHGIQNLRVADCSVVPFALSAHTNAPSYMVGEKASDMIKEQWLNNFDQNDKNFGANNVKKRFIHRFST